jgi:hypothetical protein
MMEKKKVETDWLRLESKIRYILNEYKQDRYTMAQKETFLEQAYRLLSDMEELIGKESLSLYNSSWEGEE